MKTQHSLKAKINENTNKNHKMLKKKRNKSSQRLEKTRK